MRAGRQEISIAALCGMAAGLGFGWQGGWVVVLLALAILLSRLTALKGRSVGEARKAAALLAVFVFCLYGVGHIGLPVAIEPSLRVGTLLVVFYFALAQSALAWLSGYLTFRLPLSIVNRLLLVLPALWLAREWVTSRIDVTVPWLAVGYAQAPDGPLAPLFPVGGVFLVGWASLIVSSAIALACKRELPKPAVFACIVASLLAVAASGRIGWTEPSGDLPIELVQTGASPDDSANAIVAGRALKMVAEVVASSHARLIVTPQFAIPKTPEALPPGYLSDLDRRLEAKNADVLLGMYFLSDTADEYYNGVAGIGASGEQHYFKQHLFPFGEYLPFSPRVREWINSKLDRPRANGARGPLVVEPLFGGGLRLAIAVCYEVAFGDTLRLQAASSDALINIASEGTHASPQLVGQSKQSAQARALEFQKPLIRTSDVRGTFFMDSHGRISGELPEGVFGTITRTVQGRTGLTPYARWGDMLALGVAGLSIALCLFLVAAERNLRAGRQSIASGKVPALLPNARLSAQRGQVLPMALALLVIVAGFFYFMVNTGQTVTEKIRVTNAADAAAYSAAVVEARALNYDAYLNRAMLANQMAIAQMVSFASWIDYFATAADEFGSYVTDMNYYVLPNPKVAVLDVAFGGSALVAAYFSSTVHQYADYLVDYLAGAIITVHDLATTALSVSQMAVQLDLTGGIRQGQIADQVVKAMDPNLTAEVVLVSHGFDLFTKNYSGDDRNRFADVAMRSRGLFTRERNFTIDSFDIPLVRKDGALKKRGGTDLVGLDEWRGVDTLELHGRQFKLGCGRFGLIGWCNDIKTPIGWGAIEVDANGGDSGRGYHGNAYNENPTTADKADSAMRSPTYGYFSGIPRSQEISDTDSKKDESTAITILVTKSQSDTLTSGNAASLTPAGALAVFNDHPAGGKLASLGRAQVYFDRIAARGDGKTELGSLYNPYWRVRLVAPTMADRVYASTKQGGLRIPPMP